MSEEKNQIKLKGRVLFQFEVEAKTGLHIGGSDTDIEIGGVNKIVIRNPWDNQPYIPGSSLKGKIRSLIEKYKGLAQNNEIGSGVKIHTCENKKDYQECPLCQAFGLPGELDFATPTRLVVRDTYLSDLSKKTLEEGSTDLPYTEVKTEVSIDRVTSQANPRSIERVPAGVTFGDEQKPAEMIYSLYEGTDMVLADDIANLRTVLEGLALLEDDYLGGAGSRGSGKVEIQNIRVSLRTDYSEPKPTPLGKEGGYESISDLLAALETLQGAITEKLTENQPV